MPPSPLVLLDRHPRLGLGLLAARSYIFGVAVLYYFAAFWVNQDLSGGSRVAADVAYAVLVSLAISYGQLTTWRRERDSAGLQTLSEWWLVARCLERGHAPREQRLWWAADDLVQRHLKLLRRRRFLGLVPPLLGVVLLVVVDAPDDWVRYGLMGLCAASAVAEPFLRRRQEKALLAARAELDRSRPVPPEPTGQVWSSELSADR